ncbi:MAG TPA: hypothetical protein DDX89_06640 [Candidatus Omnitrophica bacterium]|nr:MAG: hypothetical protein A2Z92_01510 [Omnitrophica WOR_2 bacterium GWA2_63_20]OGX16951.1 MAG: hypothetical protein A2105_00180 [Omnitrophica WOR_2 bacterium GWF2_63_9]OGX30781.1 MAG: hypothetical protein A3E56_04955 [Omnitrophica WOR_2 bacterium RIFCSPHIGHO2_12_FULL_64_13]OGX36049.1 MAG: hypothetical protein A3B73_04070 [Omnitrophica WOR_2 bacterium RIFCSPHIGHO2_02_FULL_63_39]OGX44136.1 MAG: hypothetical protein A3I71_05720 [Omnitrophica WOR_2 bacterium RIFCSPLOWO2_02_FULL_63_16]OGX49043.1
MNARRGWLLLRVAVGTGIVGSLWMLQGLVDAQTTGRTKAPVVDAAAVDQKLATILENQQLILQRMETLLEELRIVKVRCTR